MFEAAAQQIKWTLLLRLGLLAYALCLGATESATGDTAAQQQQQLWQQLVTSLRQPQSGERSRYEQLVGAHERNTGFRPAPRSAQLDEYHNDNHNHNHNHDSNRNRERDQQQQQPADDEYSVGVGMADITGPAADINLMGYAKPNQDAGGIHLRQFSRALVIEHGASDKTRIVYASLDNGMVSQLVRMRTLGELAKRYGAHVYNSSNVMISATHTHSAPGGFFEYLLYNIPSAGYIQQTADALVDGIVRSIVRAHESMRPQVHIYMHKGDLLDASVNRSPTSYANNPPKERAKYEHDTDKTMHLLRFVDSRTNESFAMLNWFAVHGTSMNNTNHLISSDNKGYAAILFEQEFNSKRRQQQQQQLQLQAPSLPGTGEFVAIFAQANEGDVSPNTRGPRCVDTGLPCDLSSSTCGNPPRNEKCIASGPGRDMFESTKIIAHKQYYKARELFLDTHNQVRVAGPVKFAHEYIDMTQQRVALYENVVDFAQLQQQLSSEALARTRRVLEQRLKHASHHQRQQHRVANTALHKSKQLRRLDAALAAATTDSGHNTDHHNDDARLPSALTEDITPFEYDILTKPIKPFVQVNDSYTTCVASLGYSFAAGTTDGPGAFDFRQGGSAATRYWDLVRDFLKKPSQQLVDCQKPKPILLATGQINFPSMWHPKIVPTQIVQIGQLAIVGLPGEFTTMSGRRVREAVQAALDSETRRLEYGRRHWPAGATGARQRQPVQVVLSGLSNIYSSYITTFEEYQMQRYEGASTLYGPHTLQAYVNQFVKLAKRLARNQAQPAEHVQPPDLTKSLFSLKPGVIYDGTPRAKTFGSVLVDANTSTPYKCGDTVRVTFVAGNPRNDLRQEGSFLYVDKLVANNQWFSVASDASWDTKFVWERTNSLMGESRATVEWQIPILSGQSAQSQPQSHEPGAPTCEPGTYRIRHLGAYKSFMRTVNQYAGESSPFSVEAA